MADQAKEESAPAKNNKKLFIIIGAAGVCGPRGQGPEDSNGNLIGHPGNEGGAFAGGEETHGSAQG